jgi:hypothetical protein
MNVSGPFFGSSWTPDFQPETAHLKQKIGAKGYLNPTISKDFDSPTQEFPRNGFSPHDLTPARFPGTN